MSSSAELSVDSLRCQAASLADRREFAASVGVYRALLLRWPEDEGALRGLGRALLTLSRPGEALECFDRALALDPGVVDAHLGHAASLRALRRPEEALVSLDKASALSPDNAPLQLSRGAVLLELQRWNEALEACDRAIALGFDRPEIHLNRVTPLLRLQRREEALSSCNRAIEQLPPTPAAYILRGITFLELSRPEEAAADFQKASTLDPASADAQMWLGRARMELGSRRAALANYDRALELRENFTAAHNNRGIALFELGEWEAARAAYEWALSLESNSAELHCNVGVLFQAQNHSEAALASFEKAIQADPTFAKARFNRATALLLSGNYERGWAELEWRHRARQGQCVSGERNLAQLRPDKSSLRNQTIFVYGEWGLGDTIQFCRYVPLLAELGARVILQVSEALSTLLATLPGVSEMLPADAPVPNFDYHCPMLSLPLFFNTTLDTLPAQVPYLFVDTQRRRAWTERLGAHTKPRVGLVWSGGFRPELPEFWPANERRNVPLELLATLNNPNVEFYSLQKGQPAESELDKLLAAGWSGPRLNSLMREVGDFADTAALIEQLDLVISVDTATAHLAGALGKPVWILNRFDTCWRWLLNRHDSPWYSTARLYRQLTPGNWRGVIARVRIDLASWAASQ